VSGGNDEEVRAHLSRNSPLKLFCINPCLKRHSIDCQRGPWAM